MLYHNTMLTRPTDPLALSSGAGSRLALAAALSAGLWAAVAWALSA